MDSGKVFGILFSIMVVLAGVLAYTNYQKSEELDLKGLKIEQQDSQITSLEDTVQERDAEIDQLKDVVEFKESEISTLSTEVQEKAQQIKSTTEALQQAAELAEDRQEEIAHLREVQKSLSEQGKLIVDQYGATLILYDSADVYETQSEYAEMLMDDPVNYGSLGMPFIYFKAETKEVEDGAILGTYNSLYNYIFIYENNNNVRTLYHEIAHLLYFKYFINVDDNLDVWLNIYTQLKDQDALSTNYAEASPEEGFAEEYSVYKTGVKEQPQVLKDLFKQVDNLVD